jgi:hypothetical protein
VGIEHATGGGGYEDCCDRNDADRILCRGIVGWRIAMNNAIAAFGAYHWLLLKQHIPIDNHFGLEGVPDLGSMSAMTFWERNSAVALMRRLIVSSLKCL